MSESFDQGTIFRRLLKDIRDGYDFEFIDKLHLLENIDRQDVSFVLMSFFFIYNGLLHVAIESCNYPAAIELIHRKANVNLKNNKELTPLHIAIWKGFLHIAAPLLKATDYIDEIDKDGRPPLYFAVERGDLRAIQLLLHYKANPNIIIKGKSLLSIACRRGYPEAIQMLLDAKAIFLPNDANPIMEAVRSGKREALAVILKNHAREAVIPLQEESILVTAIKEKSSLLPVLSRYIAEQTMIFQASGIKGVPTFPPRDLKSSARKRLQKAYDANDTNLSTQQTEKRVKQLKSPWISKPQAKQELTTESEVHISNFTSDVLTEHRESPAEVRKSVTSRVQPDQHESNQYISHGNVTSDSDTFMDISSDLHVPAPA